MKEVTKQEAHKPFCLPEKQFKQYKHICAKL